MNVTNSIKSKLGKHRCSAIIQLMSSTGDKRGTFYYMPDPQANISVRNLAMPAASCLTDQLPKQRASGRGPITSRLVADVADTTVPKHTGIYSEIRSKCGSLRPPSVQSKAVLLGHAQVAKCPGNKSNSDKHVSPNLEEQQRQQCEPVQMLSNALEQLECLRMRLHTRGVDLGRLRMHEAAFPVESSELDVKLAMLKARMMTMASEVEAAAGVASAWTSSAACGTSGAASCTGVDAGTASSQGGLQTIDRQHHCGDPVQH